MQRTWLHPDPAKAPLAHPRKALGRIHGRAVRFPTTSDDDTTFLAGEGIETVLSLVAALGPQALAARLAPLLGLGP